MNVKLTDAGKFGRNSPSHVPRHLCFEGFLQETSKVQGDWSDLETASICASLFPDIDEHRYISRFRYTCDLRRALWASLS